MKLIIASIDHLSANKNLEQILQGASRPLRTIALEQLPAPTPSIKGPGEGLDRK
jgi:hypothetical protein